jgi:hypothetical protein
MMNLSLPAAPIKKFAAAIRPVFRRFARAQDFINQLASAFLKSPVVVWSFNGSTGNERGVGDKAAG